MTKIMTVEIEKCVECDAHTSRGFSCHCANKINKKIPDCETIPKWCPLPDKPKEQGK